MALGDVSEKVAGAWVLRGNIAGQDGRNGEQWWTGTGAPSAATGLDGDWYLDSDPALVGLQNPPLVSALPGSPIDGQECYFLADATNGIVWHLRYRATASGSYKWECIGGPPLFKRDATRFTTGSTSWTQSGNDQPKVTTPLAGDYDVRIMYTGASNIGGGILQMSAWGLTPNVVVPGGVVGLTQTNAYAFTFEGGGRVTFNVPTDVVTRYAVGSSTGFFDEKNLWVQPVRVG